MSTCVYFPRLTSSLGGGKKVHYTIIDILEDEADNVTSYINEDRTVSEINNYYDLNIQEANLQKLKTPWYLKFIRKFDRFFWLQRALENFYSYRKAVKISKESDLLFVTSEMWDSIGSIDCPAIEYVHMAPPEEVLDEKPGGYRHLIKLFTSGYIFSNDFTIFNSDFTEENTTTDSDSRVIYPPIDSDIESREWEEKENQAIIVGRISPDKEIKEAIEIFSEVEIDLVVAGFIDDEEYYQGLTQIADQKNWLEIKGDLEWEKLKEKISSSKIGLMCKRNEDFGMPAVEYMYGNCIPLVYKSAGLPYTVGKDELTYQNVSEAREKIERIIEDPEEYLDYVRKHRKNFSEKKFREEIKEVVEEVAENV